MTGKPAIVDSLSRRILKVSSLMTLAARFFADGLGYSTYALSP